MDLVTSDSMNPTLMEGDVVAWTPVNIEDVKVGDVVVFKSYVHWPGEKIVVHRVAGITTNSKGTIELLTKGDNNPSTDQAGAHILEPPIGEDHLLGKTISVAQQPLKIPFIGNIGLWINQGLDSLSKPTSSKESFSYIGIFAPLTISAVILVIMIFVLPEKAKTLKEKIRFNIFGPKPLKFKRTIVTFLVAYIVFLTLIHAFAYDSMSSSVGIDGASPESAMNFGRIQAGTDSFPKEMPLINPSTMPVKGIVFGRGDMQQFASMQIFELNPGETKTTSINALSKNTTQNGSYLGEIVVYSSPFWLLFPNDFIQNLINWNPEMTIFVLDLLSALFLTFITLTMLLTVTFTGDKIKSWAIDISWRYPSRIILREKYVKKMVSIKNKIKHSLVKSIGWIMRVDFSENKYKEKLFFTIGKPVLATVFVVPIIILLDDQMLGLFIAVIIAGIIAYFVSCKIRNKIILAAFITTILATIHMIIRSNLVIASKGNVMLEKITLATGAIGIYLLILSLILIPLALLSWAIARFIRNLKERKDPLLSLEGNCDL